MALGRGVVLLGHFLLVDKNKVDMFLLTLSKSEFDIDKVFALVLRVVAVDPTERKVSLRDVGHHCCI